MHTRTLKIVIGLILMLPFIGKAQNPTQADTNRLLRTVNGRMGIDTNGAAVGQVPTRTAGGVGWGTPSSGGNVFTSSNNTFVAGRTNTFNGIVIIDGIRYPTADGTTNQVMTFGGNGTLYPSTITSGGGGDVFRASNNVFTASVPLVATNSGSSVFFGNLIITGSVISNRNTGAHVIIE